MLPKPIAHWIFGHVSRETLKWIIGSFLCIQMLIIPLIVVVVLFVGLRKVGPAQKTGIMFTRIGNLILASLFFLGMIWPTDWRLLSPPPSPAWVEPRPFYDTMVAWLICVWFISAGFLFFRSRLAWFGSLLGVGSAICLFAVGLIGAMRGFIFPNDDEAAHMAQIHGVALIMAMMTLLGFLVVCLAFSVGLFIGLLKRRSELR